MYLDANEQLPAESVVGADVGADVGALQKFCNRLSPVGQTDAEPIAVAHTDPRWQRLLSAAYAALSLSVPWILSCSAGCPQRAVRGIPQSFAFEECYWD
jgi:hypothetical protein